MRRFANIVSHKFQEWALNHLDTIFWLWIGVSLAELAKVMGVFNALFESLQWAHTPKIFDWFWYVNTAYIIGSALFRLIYYNRPKRIK